MATTTVPTISNNTITPAPSSPPPVKPGWKTSEFILSTLAMILGQLYAGGLIGNSGTVAVIAGMAVTVLGALGYTVTRGAIKVAASRAQRGFASLPMMAMLAIAGLLFATFAGCAQVKADEANAIACAKAEASVIAKGASVLQVAGDVVSALALYETGGTSAVLAGIEALVAKYGEPIVACAVNAAPAAAVAGAGSASHAELAPTAKQVVLGHYGWRFAP